MKDMPSMRRITVICAFVLLLQLAAGCDFFRVVAGRPTSKELEQKRETVVAKEIAEREAEARERFVRDSLAASEKHLTDSVAAETFFKETKVSRIRSGALPGLRTDDFPYRYCIVLAGFTQPQNAENFSARLKEAGYEPVVLRYTRGNNTVVGVNPSDDIAAIRASYEKVRTEKFCPRDAWIFIKD